ncbi:hypothetical protein AVEN_161128-1 [Araneus ventricosus]|uniref:Uncharacterized protein n=1 Tax=Araneus ventricosus TaxID=182803 RepID=A0A4Y2K3A2_ARAVE|nr:hypothetical protein AVEN_161128-1 [Araneus ventricosus]
MRGDGGQMTIDDIFRRHKLPYETKIIDIRRVVVAGELSKDFRINGPAKKLHPGTKHNLGIIPKPGSKCNHTPEYVPQYVVIPQYIPTSGSIFASVPSVTLYTNTLLEAIYSTDILLEVFDLSQTTAKQYADFLTM